jgi:hypothetical protein
LPAPHARNHPLDVRNRRLWQNAVTEIEDVARAAEIVADCIHFPIQGFAAFD